MSQRDTRPARLHNTAVHSHLSRASARSAQNSETHEGLLCASKTKCSWSAYTHLIFGDSENICNACRSVCSLRSHFFCFGCQSSCRTLATRSLAAPARCEGALKYSFSVIQCNHTARHQHLSRPASTALRWLLSQHGYRLRQEPGEHLEIFWYKASKFLIM